VGLPEWTARFSVWKTTGKDSFEACVITCQNSVFHLVFPSDMTSHNNLAQFNCECIAPFRMRGSWYRSFVFSFEQCPPRPCPLHPCHRATCYETSLSVQEVYDEQMKIAITRDFGVRSAIPRIRGEEKMLRRGCSVPHLYNTFASDVWLL